MSSATSHTKRLFLRQLISAGMVALYLVMVFSPLASFAMHSTKSAAMGIRECSGDCNICGCSPESRAATTCCCAKKKAQQSHDHDHAKDSNEKPEKQASIHEDDADGASDCCKKDSAPQKPVIISCGCPCGNSKQAALTISSSSEVLPFHFTEQFSISHISTSFFSPPHSLTSRHVEPPDPPPKLV